MSKKESAFEKSYLSRKPSLIIPDPNDDICQQITPKTSLALDLKPSTPVQFTLKYLRFVCISPPNTGFLLSNDSSYNETYFSTTKEPTPVNVDFIYYLNKPQTDDEFAVIQKDPDNDDDDDDDDEDDDKMNLEHPETRSKKKSKKENLFRLSEVTLKTPKTNFGIGSAMLFCFRRKPDREFLKKFNDFTEETWVQYQNDPFQVDDGRAIAFFHFKEDEDCKTLSFPKPEIGTYLVLKLIKPKDGSDKRIDILKVNFLGSYFEDDKVENLDNSFLFGSDMLKAFNNKEYFTDLTLIVPNVTTTDRGDGQGNKDTASNNTNENKSIFHVHRAILSQCKYFNDLLIANNNKTEIELKVNGVSPVAIAEVLRYLYSGILSVSDDYINDVVEAIDIFGLPNLKDSCINYLVKTKCNENNVCTLINHAKKGRYKKLGTDTILRNCVHYIKMNTSKVFRSPDLCSLDKETFLSLVKSNNLTIDNEITVFNAIVNWGQNILKNNLHNGSESSSDNTKDFDNAKGNVEKTIGNAEKLVVNQTLKDIVGDLVVHVKYPLIPLKTLVNVVKPLNIVPMELYKPAIEYQVAEDYVDRSLFKENEQYIARISLPRIFDDPDKQQHGGGQVPFVFNVKRSGNPMAFELSKDKMTVKKIGGENLWNNCQVFSNRSIVIPVYCEVLIQHINADKTGIVVGICKENNNNTLYSSSVAIGCYGHRYNLDSSSKVLPPKYGNGDRLGVWVDPILRKIAFYKNGHDTGVFSNITYSSADKIYFVVHLHYIKDSVTLKFSDRPASSK